MTWWTFRILSIFSAREKGKGESGATGRGGVWFLLEITEAVLPGEGRGGRARGRESAGNFGGEGAKYFFFGVEILTKMT